MKAIGRTSARTLATLILLGTVASAAPSKVLVLQAEGRADGKVRAKVHGAVVKLAKSSGGQISPGDITYADAAAAVGCRPEAASCKDEVIGMLSVDEIVITNVTPKPGGFEVVVSRVGKGGSTKDARTVITADRADHLEAIAPLFGGAAAEASKPDPKGDPKADPRPDPKSHVESRPPEPPPRDTPPPEPTVSPLPPASDPAPPPDQYVVRPQIDRPRDRTTLYVGGMATGAAMFVVGAVLWTKASSIQSDIDAAPTSTQADLLRIQELESSGDNYAGWGNVLAIGGVVAGGVSTYLYVRNRRLKRTRTMSSATLTPVLSNGLVGLTFGGAL